MSASYEKQIEVIAALRKVFDKFSHYQTFTKRVLPFLREALPEYTVTIDVEGNRCIVKVWGNGIDYNDCVYITWSCLEQSKPIKWQDGFLRALERADLSDYAEREAHEKALIPQLEKLNTEVQDRVRAARILIESLPVPMSATVRKDQHHWSNASRALCERFPILFKSHLED